MKLHLNKDLYLTVNCEVQKLASDTESIFRLPGREYCQTRWKTLKPLRLTSEVWNCTTYHFTKKSSARFEYHNS